MSSIAVKLDVTLTFTIFTCVFEPLVRIHILRNEIFQLKGANIDIISKLSPIYSSSNLKNLAGMATLLFRIPLKGL